MSSLTQTITTIVAFGTVITQIAIIIGIYILISKKFPGVIVFVQNKAVLLSFLIVLGATLGSFYYSNIAGFQPCVLCWWQRVFLISQLPLLAMALRKKDQLILRYTLLLSGIGAIIAVYHSYIQYGGAEIIPCGTDINSVSCAVRYVFAFNYITIPLMSLTTFALLIVIGFIHRKATTANKKGIQLGPR